MEKQLEAIAAQLERNNQLFENWIAQIKADIDFRQSRIAPVEIAHLEASTEYYRSHAKLMKGWGEPRDEAAK